MWRTAPDKRAQHAKAQDLQDLIKDFNAKLVKCRRRRDTMCTLLSSLEASLSTMHPAHNIAKNLLEEDESDVLEVEKSLAHLQEGLDRLQGRFCAIRRLSDDVLAEVFGALAPIIHATTEFEDIRMGVSPFQLAAVCRKWRDVATITPRLWAYITIGYTVRRFSRPNYLYSKKEGLRFCEILKIQLSRCGAVPLHIVFKGDPEQHREVVHAITEILLPHMKRFETLSLGGWGSKCDALQRLLSAPMPHLLNVGARLTADPYPGGNGFQLLPASPALRRVSVESFKGFDMFLSSQPSVSALALRESPMEAVPLSRILRQFPGLISLHLDVILYDASIPPMANNPGFPKLLRLLLPLPSVDEDILSATQLSLLSKVLSPLPALRSVSVSVCSSTEDLKNFLLTTCLAVLDLEIRRDDDTVDFDINEAMASISMLSALRRLRLCLMDIDNKFFDVFEPGTSQNCQPFQRLTVLELDSCELAEGFKGRLAASIRTRNAVSHLCNLSCAQSKIACIKGMAKIKAVIISQPTIRYDQKEKLYFLPEDRPWRHNPYTQRYYDEHGGEDGDGWWKERYPGFNPPFDLTASANCCDEQWWRNPTAGFKDFYKHHH